MDLLRFLLRLPFMLITLCCRLLRVVGRLCALLLRPLFGKLAWQPPAWQVKLAQGFQQTEQWVVNHAGRVSVAVLLLIIATGGGYYGYISYLNRPKPIELAPMVYQRTTVDLSAPGLYNYQATTPSIRSATLNFSHSAAPIVNVGKVVQQGIKLQPALDGEWKWSNESTLSFIPTKPWPMGTTYKVQIDAATLLAPQIKLQPSRLEFTTPAFAAKIANAEFYQDPQHPEQKKAIFQVQFNAPVEVLSFEKQIGLLLITGKDAPTRTLNYQVIYDEKKLNAWVHSEPLQPLSDGGAVQLRLGKEIKSTQPANTTSQVIERQVKVPRLYSLAVSSIDATLVESDDSNGERALVVALNDAVNEREIQQAVRAWLLPQHNPNDQYGNKTATDFYDWSMNELDEPLLATSPPLTLSINEGEQEYQPLFSFKFDAPSNRRILVEVTNTLTSVGGYKLPEKHYQLLTVPDYPQLLRFMSQGSLLSLRGDRQITVATRNLSGLKLDIKRVIPSQLQHIVSFKENEYSSARFNRLNADYFTEHFQYQKALDNEKPGETSYQGIDLSRYLSADPNARRGVFLLTLSPWDPDQKLQEGVDEEYEDEEQESDSGDSRFVVITDLGIISKTSLDNGRDLFIQSIDSGLPVEGAKVSVVAKNGTTLLSQITGADGHVSFPTLEGFKNERQAVMFLVEKEGDISFLPARATYDRQLDLSRFAIDGEENPRDPRTLNSYLFSDRGVYRPGDTFNIGLITRAADWSIGLAGVPLRAEIRDPRDTLMSTVPLKLDANGFNELSYTTAENSPTGEWTVYLFLLDKDNSTSALLGHIAVNVKEFEPDQLKVKLQLTPDRQQGWVKPQELQASIDVQNLFGTPAQDRRITSKLILRPTYPNFTQFPDYQFYENQHNNDGFDNMLAELTTDEHGQANIPLDLSSYANATYQLQLLSEAFEAGGGRSVAATARALVSPYDHLIGIKADGDLGYINRDAKRQLHIIAIDPNLQQIPLPDLQLELIEQKYISVLTKQNSGVYKYQSKLKEEQIDAQPLSIGAQGSDFTLATNRPGDYVLLIKDDTGQVLNRLSYSVAGNANLTRSLDRNAELKLKLDRAEYHPNDEIEIAINAPYVGSGLITIERDKVYSWQWFHTDTTSSVQRIRLPAGIEGNAYINVQFVRDVNSDEIFMSPLSYGVVPFKISTEARRAGIQLSAPETLKPGQILPITVTTDQPQRVVVFAVDEGILQVARYRLKDPLEYFFRKRELSVESAQILDLILPEFSKLMQLTSAPGGDAGEGLDLHLNPFKRKRDKPVAYWSGITEVKDSAIFEYPLPDYFNGKVRIMAISVTPERIGHAQRYSTVRDNVILTPNVPAMVAPGDEFDVSVGVANNLQGQDAGDLTIRVELIPPPQLEIVGDAQHSLQLAEKREGLVSFRLRAKSALGDAPLLFRAHYAAQTSQRNISTSVRPAMPFRTQSVMGRMDGKNQRVDGLRQMFDAHAQRQASVSHSPLVLTSGLAEYLNNYPYYCSEQLVSRAIPLLLQGQHPELRSPLSQAEVREQLKNILSTLRSRQNGSGAIGQWRSSPNPDPFITPYTVQYLLEAQSAGYPLPAGMLQEANVALRQLAANNAYDDSYQLRLRAFAVYLLTRQGEITTGLLASVQDQLQRRYPDSWQQDLSALYLASSYRLLKMDDEANKLLLPTWKQLSKAYDRSWWTQEYYDPLVQDAIRLYLITRHFPEKAQEIPAQVLENMVLALRAERYTTHSSAMSILALESYSTQIASQRNDASTLRIDAQGNQSGATPQTISTLQGLFARGTFTADTRELQFDNTSSAPAWYVVSQSGFDIQAPEKAISRGLEVTRDYRDEQGQPLQQVVLGQKINVHLKVRANSSEGQSNLAIVDLLPGGFEVVQQTPPEPEGSEEEAESEQVWRSPLTVAGSTWEPDYSDIREDRVIIYGSASTEVKEFIYQIKATNTGSFLVPPAYGEAMYDREVQALSVGGDRILVVAPTGQ